MCFSLPEHSWTFLAIGMTLLLGLATWGLYRLAVALKEPS